MNKSKLINNILFKLNLGIDSDRIITDQETGSKILIKGKPLLLKEYGSVYYENEVEFDPINNQKLTSSLLSLYNKYLIEEGYESVSIYFYLPPNKDGKVSISAKTSNDRVIITKPYFNDSLRIIDLIFKISGEDIELEEFDSRKEANNDNKQKSKRSSKRS